MMRPDPRSFHGLLLYLLGPLGILYFILNLIDHIFWGAGQ